MTKGIFKQILLTFAVALTLGGSSAFAAATIDAIGDMTIPEDAAVQTVNLSGISGTSPLVVTAATTTNAALIPNPTVTYTSPNATGSISFQSALHLVGTATITVTVTENGGGTATTIFNVTVSPNSAPTISTPGTVTVPEDSGLQTVNLTGIGNSAGGLETRQVLSVSATSNNTGLIPNPTTTYTSPNATGTLTFTPVAHQVGSATITLTVSDDGGTTSGGTNTTTTTFTITVSPNVQPTLSAIANPAAFPEDSGAHSVNLAGIGAGTGETQSLTVTATSSNTSLIPNGNISVTYTSPNPTGSVSFTAVAHQVGSAVITVKVQDNGGTSGGGVDTVTQTFTVTVSPNTPPTLAAIPNPPAFPEDSGAHSVNLAGISAGVAGETQTLTVTATSSNTTLIPNGNIVVTYASPGATGSVSFTAAAHQVGSAVISVNVQDNGGTATGGVDSFTQTFTVVVSPNTPPTLAAITNPPAFPEDSGAHSVNLAGISAGAAGETQVLTVTATSSNTTLIPNGNISVTYASPGATGSVSFTAVAHQVGTATISVKVQDDGGTASGGVDNFTQTFLVTISPNAAPTIAATTNPTFPEDSGAHTINLTGITAGAGETQALTVGVASGNTTLIPSGSLSVSYTSPNSTATINFTAAAHQVGTAVITVTVQDNGGTASSGVNTTTQLITVTISANVAPTISSIANPAAFPEDSPVHSVAVSGIGAGAGETQGLTVTATSGNTTLIPNGNITVTYTSPNATATIGFTAAAHQVGTAVITVKVQDDGGVTGGGVDSSTQTFTVTISPNVAPTIAAITNPAAFPEDSPAHSVSVSGIGAGTGETQGLTVTATSGNTTLIPNGNITVTYTSPNATATIGFTAALHQVGTAVITVKVQDDGGVAGGGVDSSTQTFTVTISPNVAPTIAAITNPAAFPEDSPAHSVAVSGIGAGAGETQGLTVTATSGNTTLIPNGSITVTYTSPNATATIGFTAALHQVGTAVITVKVQDDGGVANGGVDSSTQTFTVTISPNVAPTLSPISNPVAILEESGQQTVNFAGVGPGAGETQTVTVSATSSNPSLIPNPVVSYTNPNATGFLTYTPVAHQSGTATITVTATDDGGTALGGVNNFSQTFVVTVLPNAAPTLDTIAAVIVPEDATQQTVNLTGIGTGGEANQVLTVTATSNNQALIPDGNLIIAYNSPTATGTLKFTSVLHQTGAATVTVKVQDNGGTANGGQDTITRSFLVTLSPNKPPTLDPIQNVTIPEDAVQQSVQLSGIKTDAGGLEVRQNLTVTATSGDQSIIRNSDIIVSYSSPGNIGTISYLTVLHAVGVVTITVKVQDDGGTANSGTDAILQTFNVTVSPNKTPTLDPIPNASIPEDNVQQTVVLTGIFTDSTPVESRQILSITATSDNQIAIRDADIAIVYIPNSVTATLTYTSALHGAGLANITVKVQDDGGTANAGVNSVTRSFAVTVQPNKAPTLDPILNQIVAEDSITQTVNLSGIKSDAAQVEVRQLVTVSATSSNQSVIKDSDISITNIKPDFTAVLSYITVLHATGSTVVTVQVQDNGGTLAGGTDTFTQAFTVTVSANQQPLLIPIADPAPINENAATQSITLAGIKTGASQLEVRQTLTVTATSNNQVLIPDANITVSYNSPNLGGLISYFPVAHTNGTAVITVKVQDDGGTANGGSDTITQSFTVVVNQVYEPAIVTDGPKVVNTPVNARPLVGMIPDSVALPNQPVALTVSILDYDIDAILNGSINNISTRDTLLFQWSALVNGLVSPNAIFAPNNDVPANPASGSTLTKAVNVTFTQAGIYTVVLKITGVAGNVATGTDSVTVSNLIIPVNTPPTLGSVQLPDNQSPVLSVGQNVTISAYSTPNGDPAKLTPVDPDGDTLLYIWSFKRADDANDDNYIQFATTNTNAVTFNTSDAIFQSAFGADDLVNILIECVATDLPTRTVNAGYSSTPPSKPTAIYILDGYPPNYRSPEDTRTVLVTFQNPNNSVKSKLSTVVRNPINKITLFSLGGRGIFQVDARYIQDNQLRFSGDGNAAHNNDLTLQLDPDPTQIPVADGMPPDTVGEIEGVLNPLYPLVVLPPAPNPDSKFFAATNIDVPKSDLLHNPFTVSLVTRGNPNNIQAEGVSLIVVRDLSQSDPNHAIAARRMIPITTVESQTAEGPTTVPVPGDYGATFISGRFGFRDGKRDLVSFRGVVGPVTNPSLNITGDKTKPNKISVGLGNIVVEGKFVLKGTTAKVTVTKIFDDGFHKPLTPRDVSIFRVQTVGSNLLINLSIAGDNLAARGFDTAGVTDDGLKRFGVAPPPGYGTVQNGKLTQIFIQSAVVVGQEGKLNNNFDSIVRCFFFVKGGVGRIVGQNFK